jgi:thiol-disulfide isomerase/thioredoxin
MEVAPAIAQPTALEVIDALRTKLERSPSMAYEAECQAKLIGLTDPLTIAGSVYLMRLADDTVTRGLMRVDHDSVTMTFAPGAIVEYNRAQQRGIHDHWATSKDPTTVRLEGLLQIREYMNPAVLTKRAGPAYQQEVKDTLLADGRVCWQLHVQVPDDARLKNDNIVCTISKQDSLPVRIIHSLVDEGDVQRLDLRITAYRGAGVGANFFTADVIIPGGQVEDRKADPEDAPMAVGELVPSYIRGDVFGSSPEPDSMMLATDLTVLDFWYMSCSPCRQSMPALDSLYTSYAPRGVRFIGANAYDGDLSERPRLEKFLSAHPIAYPILFIPGTVLADCKITAHPTIYVIDRSGKIKYVVPGYFDGMRKAVADVLDSLLKEP